MISFVVVLVLLICFIIYCNTSPEGCDLCNSENCKNDCLKTPEVKEETKPEVTKEPISDPVVEKVAKKVAKKAAKKTTKKKKKE